MKKIIIICLILISVSFSVNAQDADALVKKVKAKLEQVNNYVAEGK